MTSTKLILLPIIANYLLLMGLPALATEQPHITEPPHQPDMSQVNSIGINVIIKPIKRLEGELHYQLFQCPSNKTASWDELKLIKSDYFTVTQKEMMFELSIDRNTPYVFRIFQDINQNGLLDFSDNQVPLEPTGFSNNPSLMQGEPKPIENCFQFQAEGELNIRINNKRKRRRR